LEKSKWRARDYVVIPRSLLTTKLTPASFRTWIALASFCYDSDSCFPSNRAILERMPPGTSLGTIQTAKRDLERAGLIHRTRRFVDGRETTTVYNLLAPEGTEMITPNDKSTPVGAGSGTPLNKEEGNKIKGVTKRTKEGDVFIKGVGWVADNENT